MPKHIGASRFLTAILYFAFGVASGLFVIVFGAQAAGTGAGTRRHGKLKRQPDDGWQQRPAAMDTENLHRRTDRAGWDKPALAILTTILDWSAVNTSALYFTAAVGLPA